ncbi:MAG: hypothetical protein AAGK37_16340 [Pseudomonadota bacterium]
MARIVQDTPDEIVIEDRPWLLGLILASTTIGSVALFFHAWDNSFWGLGAVSALMTLGTFYSINLVIKLSRLSLHPDGRAVLSVRDHKGWTDREFVPGSLRAGLETNRMSDTETTRAVLLIDSASGVERVPFTAYFSSSSSAEAAVRRINEWRRSETARVF